MEKTMIMMTIRFKVVSVIMIFVSFVCELCVNLWRLIYMYGWVNKIINCSIAPI